MNTKDERTYSLSKQAKPWISRETAQRSLRVHTIARYEFVARRCVINIFDNVSTIDFKMMWWAMWCCAAAAAVCVRAAPPALPAIDLAQIEQSEPDDQETLSYAVGPLSAHYAPEPWLYLLADLPRDSQNGVALWNGLRAGALRPKRKMPSLSINNPMEVLRQRLLQEVARKQMREASQRQAAANRLFLKDVGKRGFWTNTMPAHARYDMDN